MVEAVLGAELSVWIGTANLKAMMIERRGLKRRGRQAYRGMLDALAEHARRGVDLRILHAALPSRPFREAFDALPELVEGGLTLKMCPRVHLKTVIVDGRFIYIGSANWTGAGLGVKGEGRRNFELGVVTEDEAMLDEVQAIYDRIWRGLECGACRLKATKACESPLDV